MTRISMSVLVLVVACGADWPQWMGPTRDGVTDRQANLPAWGESGPKQLWKREVGTGWSSPIVVGGRVYLHQRVSDEEVIVGYSAASGKEEVRLKYPTRYRDEFNFNDGPRATPLSDGKTLFTLGADGDLAAFDLQEGTQRWRRNINADYKVPKGFFGTATSPMLAGGWLIVNVGGREAGIVAFDPTTGKEVWKATGDGVSYSSPVLATLDGQEHAVFFTRQGLVALTPKDGKVGYQFEWRPRINASVNAANPVVQDGRIFLSTSYSRGAVLLEAKGGELREVWSGDEALSCHFNTPLLHEGTLYGLDGRQEGTPRLRAVEFATGKVAWGKDRFGCASLIRLHREALALTEGGELVRFELNPKVYRETGRAKVLNSTCRASLAYANGRVFARDETTLIALEVDAGAK